MIETPAAARPRWKVGVVGAGIAGAACAGWLRKLGHAVTVFDKSRGAGGRMATRRREYETFDHGAQYFTARDPRFVDEVADWCEAGFVRAWRGRIVSLSQGDAGAVTQERRFVGVPAMSVVARRLVADCQLVPGFRAVSAEHRAGAWSVEAEDGRRSEPLDALVVAVPAPQAIPLLAASPDLAARPPRVTYSACWALMASFHLRLPVDFDGAFVKDPVLSWVARNNSKPMRPERECWVLHANPEWSGEHRDADPQWVALSMLEAFARSADVVLPRPAENWTHRWMYAFPEEPLRGDCLLDPDLRLGACGDWLAGPRVEAAWQSGTRLAERLAMLHGSASSG